MKTIVILLSVLCVAGCGKKYMPHETVDQSALTPEVTLYDLGSYYAREFRLEDGTRCIQVSSAITCEWKP